MVNKRVGEGLRRHTMKEDGSLRGNSSVTEGHLSGTTSSRDDNSDCSRAKMHILSERSLDVEKKRQELF